MREGTSVVCDRGGYMAMRDRIVCGGDRWRWMMVAGG